MKNKVSEIDNQNSRLLKYIVVAVDLVVLNAFACLCAEHIESIHGYLLRSSYWLALNFAYILSTVLFPPILQLRRVNNWAICHRALRTVVTFSVILLLFLYVLGFQYFSEWKTGVLLSFVYFIVLAVERLSGRAILNYIRSRKSNIRNVIFVGNTPNLIELYNVMISDPSYGYRVLGYFADKPNPDFVRVPYIGKVDEVESWLDKQTVTIAGLYCSLTSSQADVIRRIIAYCEHHVIVFYSVPNVRNYLKRTMNLAFYDDVPVLYLREMPLARFENRILKRAFDIVVSFVFLVFFFTWIFVIVAIIMKITMPGPIFFKQKRSGLDGKDFWCYKFRSMKVNKDANTLQATKDDPRKTKFGNIMRHTNIDELPQFWNVLIGNMSLVGPRPHMLKHTEMYSKLIDKYMVRHFAKPGITGWAQVTGARGETHELWQMEERVKKDIWYIEHWSFGLDLKIMWLTVYNVIANKNDEAY